MWLGKYIMHLYCDSDDNRRGVKVHQGVSFPVVYTGDDRRDVRAQARADGWQMSNDGTSALCPCCNELSPHYVRTGRKALEAEFRIDEMQDPDFVRLRNTVRGR